MTHPSQLLDDVVHQRVRLGILTVLSEADAVDFGFLKETLGLTDGNLSRHLSVLEDAGLVAISKGFEGKRPRTWVKATREGRTTLAEYLSTLQTLIDRAKGGST